MFVVMLVAGCAACATGGGGAVAEAPTVPTVAQTIARAVSATIALQWRGSTICAGTRVSSRRIVTAYHCAVSLSVPLDELLEIDAEGLEGYQAVAPVRVLGHVARYTWLGHAGSASGIFVHVDPLNDLAVIETDKIDAASWVEIGAPLAIGQETFAVGHPGGLEYSYSFGHVGALERELLGARWTQADIHTDGGSSGGGLFNAVGDLVGACSFGMSNANGWGFFAGQRALAKIVAQP